jgi:hypothetical protein
MGKQHQASRRRSYGRRQHEVRERSAVQHDPRWDEPLREVQETEESGFGFLEFDLAPRRLSFAVGD